MGFSGATTVAAVDEGRSEGAALGFEGGRVAVVDAVSRSSYMGFLSCTGHVSGHLEEIDCYVSSV